MLDSHTHAVSADRVRYPWADDDPPTDSWHVQAPVAAEQLLRELDGAGVAGAVLVQALGCYGEDNRYVLDSAAAHPGRLAAVGAVNALRDPDAVGQLEGFVAAGGRGVRLGLANDGADAITEDAVVAVCRAAGQLGVPVVLAIGPHQVAGVATLAVQTAGTSLLLDHCGFAALSGGPPWSDASALFALAELPQVAIKLTSMNFVDAGDHAGAFTETLVGAFGSDRVFWGSDYPHTRHVPYADLVALARQATSSLSADDAARVLGGNTARLWNLPDQLGQPAPGTSTVTPRIRP